MEQASSSSFDKALAVASGVVLGLGARALWDRVRASSAGAGGGGGKPRSLEQLVRPNIWGLKPYRCARDDFDSGVLLDANENSMGPPCANTDTFERYPSPYQWELKALVARHRGVAKENVFVGVGSDEAIDMLLRIFCVPGRDSILITPPTYGMYKVCAVTNDVGLVEVPLTPGGGTAGAAGFQLRVAAILEAVAEARGAVKIVFACTPGNPTSRMLSRADIVALLEAPEYDGIVVADEAYIDFAPEGASLSELVKEYPRLIVLQTMSKAFGLAGIRCGFALGDEAVVEVLNKVKAPYNMNKLTSRVARSAFAEIAKLRANIGVVLGERARVAAALEALPTVGTVHHSDTNFLLFEVAHAHEVYDTMAHAGVVVRYRGTETHCDGCLRATIGTREENDAFLAMLAKTAAALAATDAKKAAQE
jgi:histidinol-phosphate aminotransferase